MTRAAVIGLVVALVTIASVHPESQATQSAAERAELAKWNDPNTPLPAKGPGGTAWDAHYRTFIQTDENALSKGLPSHASAAATIKTDAAKSAVSLAEHKGWVLYIKHFSETYRPEPATRDLQTLYNDLVAIEFGHTAAAAALPLSNLPNVTILRDVVYGKTDPASQKLDAYLVRSNVPTTAVIEIHGGGWRRGAKSDFGYAGDPIRGMLAAGISVISIDYRLTPVHPFPAQMDDVVRAVQFVRANARAWNVDPNRLVTFGGSAGAHLAAWAAMHDDYAKPASADPVERMSSRVRAFVPLSGPMDLTRVRPSELASQNARGQDFAGAFTAAFKCSDQEFEHDPGVRRRVHDASPLFLASADDPPAFIMGNWNRPEPPLDSVVPAVINDPHSIWQGVLLAQTLARAGARASTYLTSEVGKDPAADARRIVAFIRD